MLYKINMTSMLSHAVSYIYYKNIIKLKTFIKRKIRDILKLICEIKNRDYEIAKKNLKEETVKLNKKIIFNELIEVLKQCKIK